MTINTQKEIKMDIITGS